MYVFKKRPASHWWTATVFIIKNRINYGDSGLSHCAATGKLLVNGGKVTMRETIEIGTTGDLLGFMLVFCCYFLWGRCHWLLGYCWVYARNQYSKLRYWRQFFTYTLTFCWCYTRDFVGQPLGSYWQTCWDYTHPSAGLQPSMRPAVRQQFPSMSPALRETVTLKSSL